MEHNINQDNLINYTPSLEQQKVWEVQLDLLRKLKEICVKYNLTYCASAGTLLGAARHKGFIPWDDDMNLTLMWPDYVKLMEVAPKECTYPYYFQSYLTEEDGEASACRLRRSDTTGFTKWEHENVGPNYDRGIFIDIFPLFNVPDSDSDRSAQKETVMFFWKCIRGHDALTQISRGMTPNNDYLQYIPYYRAVCKTMSITDIKRAYLNACAMTDAATKEIGATSSRVHLPSLMWDAKLYESYVELPFENTTITCPRDYEAVLEKQYGEWRIPVMNGARHEMVAVDTETPWREFDMTSI